MSIKKPKNKWLDRGCKYFQKEKVPGTKDVLNLEKNKKQDGRIENTQRHSNVKTQVKKLSDLFTKNWFQYEGWFCFLETKNDVFIKDRLWANSFQRAVWNALLNLTFCDTEYQAKYSKSVDHKNYNLGNNCLFIVLIKWYCWVSSAAFNLKVLHGPSPINDHNLKHVHCHSNSEIKTLFATI